MMASRSGSLDAVKTLLDHGARIDAKDTLRGTTALMSAAEQGHGAVVEMLAARGADLRAQSEVLRPAQAQGLGICSCERPGRYRRAH